MLIPHDQRRLHMPEPWSYALAAQNFAQGKWTLANDELAAARTEVRLQGSRLTQYVEPAPARSSPALGPVSSPCPVCGVALLVRKRPSPQR